MISINFGAYPRSGNTFTNSSMSNGLINVDYCVHEHNAYKLLNTLNRFTIIRNPLDAISSAIVHYSSTHDDRVNRFVEWYIDYYNQCLNKSCLFIDFNNLISNSKKVFISLLDKFQIKEHNFDFLDFSLSDKNATEPDKQYEVFKIKDEILYSQYYTAAIQIYEKILSESRLQFGTDIQSTSVEGTSGTANLGGGGTYNGSGTSPSGGYKRATITGGSGTVSWT